MAVILVLLIAATADISVANTLNRSAPVVPKWNPVAPVVPKLPAIPKLPTGGFPGGFARHRLQTQTHASEANIPVWKTVRPPESLRADGGDRSFGLSRPRFSNGRGRLGRGRRPAMSTVIDEVVHRWMGTTDKEGKSTTAVTMEYNHDGWPVLAVSLMKFDGVGFRTELREAAEAAKKMKILLMLQADLHTSAMGESAVAARLADIQLAEEFDDIPIHMGLMLNLSDPQEAGGQIDRYAKAGADVITFGPDPAASPPTTRQMQLMLYRIKKNGCRGGVVVNGRDTMVSVEPLLEEGDIDMVVIKRLRPGPGSSPSAAMSTSEVLGRIRHIRRACREYMMPEPYISVEGEVEEEDAAKLLAEGANVLMVSAPPAGLGNASAAAAALAKWHRSAKVAAERTAEEEERKKP